MFNGSNNYSLSDIAAVTGRNSGGYGNDGFGADGGAWQNVCHFIW